MLDFFSTIIEYLEFGFGIVFRTIQNSILFLQTVYDSITLPSALSVYMPPLIGISVIAVASIGVLKTVLGR